MNGCEICQQPEDDHPAYAAGAGVHDYQIPVTGPFPVTDMDRLARERREAGLDEGGQPLPTQSARPSQRPMWVPAEGGGLTQEWVEETPDTPSDRLPAQSERYSTGRVPLPPVPEDSYPPDAKDLPVEYDRPGIIRRIRNATRKASS